MPSKALSFALLAFVLFLLAASGCSSNDEGAGCVGVACGPKICGQPCGLTCGCCDGCPVGQNWTQDGNEYTCNGSCYELVPDDAGAD